MNVFLLKETLYTEYRDKVMRYMIKKVQNPNEAEDLTSEVFLKALKNIESFDSSKASVSTWIYTIARNTVTDYFRTRKDASELDENLTAAENADTSFFNNETLELLADALESLDKRSRDIVILHYYNGLPLKSVADAIGISYSHTKLLHTKALTKLKKYF